jgi:hypothetical protein
MSTCIAIDWFLGASVGLDQNRRHPFHARLAKVPFTGDGSGTIAARPDLAGLKPVGQGESIRRAGTPHPRRPAGFTAAALGSRGGSRGQSG